MTERIQAELSLIQQSFPDIVYQEEGCWVCLPSYPLPEGWNRAATDVAFQISDGYPAAPPYGFYVPSGIQFDGTTPNNYTNTASNQPPFGETWGMFSWAPIDEEWKPTGDVRRGSNLLQWARGFANRFQEVA